MDDSDFVAESLAARKSFVRSKSNIFSTKIAIESDCLLPNSHQKLCFICNKNLEKLDELRRSLHINNCLDQQEAKTKVEKQKREWYKTIDCPLCGKPLPPGPYRIAHVKKCGRENEISSSKLLSLIEAQTKVAEIKKRSGIAHTKMDEPELELKRSKRSLKEEPKSLFKEQLDMASALSASITSFNNVNSERTNEFMFEKHVERSGQQNAGSFSFVELEPRSCKCSTFDIIQENFLRKFKMKKKDNLQSVTERRNKRRNFFMDDISQCFNKLKRLERLSDDLYRFSFTVGDITIFSLENETITIHKFILAARAPSLLELVCDDGVLLLQDFTIVALRCYVRFLYSSAIEWTEKEKKEIFDLAKKYGPEGLKSLCLPNSCSSDYDRQISDIYAVNENSSAYTNKAYTNENSSAYTNKASSIPVEDKDNTSLVDNSSRKSTIPWHYKSEIHGDFELETKPDNVIRRSSSNESIILLDDSVTDNLCARNPNISYEKFHNCNCETNFPLASVSQSTSSKILDHGKIPTSDENDIFILSDGEKHNASDVDCETGLQLTKLKVFTEDSQEDGISTGAEYKSAKSKSTCLGSFSPNSVNASLELFAQSSTSVKETINHLSNAEELESVEDEIDFEQFCSRSCRIDQSFLSLFQSEMQHFSTPIEKSKSISRRLKKLLDSNVKILKTCSITPQPKYNQMTDTELKRELAKYGVRPLGRKPAIAMLQRIYDGIHPLINESVLIRKASGQINDETVFEEILYKNLDTDEIAEESYIDDYIAILPKDLDGMQRAFLNWLRNGNNKDLYNSLLGLNPISFDELCGHLSGANSVVSKIPKKALIEILDRLHITFTLPSEGWKRKRGGNNKK